MKSTLLSALREPHLSNAATSSSIEVLESRIAPSIFIVTSLADSGAGTLRAALALADSHPGPDTIIFHLPAPPVHSENIITLTSGSLTSQGDVTIKGPGAGKLIIDGGGNYSGFVILNKTTNTDQPVTISGLSVEHGKSSPYGYGGGIYSTESLTLKNVTISGNTAPTAGGVWVNGNSGRGGATKLSISNSLITGNSATGNGGGGVNFYGLDSFSMTGSVVTGNTGATTGGGIYGHLKTTGAGMTITKSLVSGNTAGYGGGLWLADNNVMAASKITISATKITGNVSNSIGHEQGGGGLFIGGGNAVVTGSTIENNTSVYYGGGLQALAFTSLTISGSTISGNRTTTAQPSTPYQGGGGIFVDGSGSAPALNVTIKGSHITDNQTAYSGGGVYAIKGIALTISSSTISGNEAISDDGGGICAYGHGANAVNLSVTGSTLSGNIAKWGGAIYAGDGNLIGTGGAFSITASKITGNSCINGGGGLYVNGSSSATVKNTTVAGNNAGLYGGGMNIAFVTGFHVSGGSFVGNSAGTNGGGIYVGQVAPGSILGVTISGNTAVAAGGGVYDANSSVTLQVAKVTGNSAPTGPDISGAGTFTYV